MSRAVMSLALAAALAATAIPAAVAAPGDAPAPAPAAEGLRPRVPGKSDPVETPRSDAPVRIQIKLKEGSTARREGSGLPVAEEHRVAQLADAGRITDLQPMVQRDVASLRALKADGEARTGDEQADMSLWLVAKVPGGQAAAVLEELNADSDVELAEVQPEAAPLPSTTAASPLLWPRMASLPASTPDLTARQVYAGGAAGYGIDAVAVRSMPGGKGQNVAVSDIEYDWDRQHEDLTRLSRPDALIANGTLHSPFNSNLHGTGVMGELVADENSGGVTGLVPEATPYMSNAMSVEVGYTPAAAVSLSADRLAAGDVILLEQQTTGCGGGYAPIEINDTVYDAVKAAVAKGGTRRTWARTRPFSVATAGPARSISRRPSRSARRTRTCRTPSGSRRRSRRRASPTGCGSSSWTRAARSWRRSARTRTWTARRAT